MRQYQPNIKYSEERTNALNSFDAQTQKRLVKKLERAMLNLFVFCLLSYVLYIAGLSFLGITP